MSRCRNAFSKAAKNTLSAILALSLAFAGVPVEALAELSNDDAALSAQETSVGDGAGDTAADAGVADSDVYSEDGIENQSGNQGQNSLEEASENNEVAVVPMDDSKVSGTCGQCYWTIDSEGLLSVFPMNGVSGRLGIDRTWNAYPKDIKGVSFADGVLLPENCSGMFYDCSSLVSLDVSGWDTTQVKDMSGMFFGCSSLVSLDVSDWDTSSVTNLSHMFGGCSALSSLDVSGWDTSSVTSMSLMFNGCSALSSLDVSGWDTSSVTGMSLMFNGCSSLSSLDVSGWDTSSVTSMSHMFEGCASLATLDLSGWDTSAVTDLSLMFYGCSSLSSLDVSGWDTSAVTDMSRMFFNCISLDDLLVSGWDTSRVENMYSMFYGCSALSSLDVSGWDTSQVEGMRGMFDGCSALSSLDVSGWDTSSVTSISLMFNGCSSLSSLDVSGWDTSQVEDMRSTFDGCSALSSLDVSDWDTSAVTDMSRMFFNCISLDDLLVSGWDTSRVEGMYDMFYGCSALSSLDVSGWDTSQVEGMRGMFDGCSALSSLDVSGWDTSSVTSISLMFNGCSSLSSLDVSGWDTSQVEDMHGTFIGCSALSSLDVSGWGTSRVENMSDMFSGCISLSYLDLSGWDTSSVTQMDAIFNSCYRIGCISIGSSFDVSQAFPPRDAWWSESEERILSVSDIKKERMGIADTYWAEEPARVTVRAERQTKVKGETDPVLAVQMDGVPEGKTVEYTIYREPGEAVGAYRIVVDGLSRQDGMLVSFEDSELLIMGSIEGASVESIPDQIYSGNEIEPEIAVSFDGLRLKKNIDYTVAYENNINAGVAKAIVSGIGQYLDSLIATYRIVPTDISGDRIDDIAECIYDGSEKHPTIVVHHNNYILREGTDYSVTYTDNVNVGESHAIIEGMGNYKGNINASFYIVPAVVEVPTAIEGLVYDGSEQAGVAAGDGCVLEGASSTAAGEYVARASLADSANYAWSDGTSEPKEIAWSIAPAVVEVPTAIEGLVYDGSEQAGVAAGDGCVLEGASSTAAGEYVARASLADSANYAWSDGTSEPKEIAWSIAPASAESFSIGNVGAQTYTGNHIEPDFLVTYRGESLVQNVDYEIHFKDNLNVGTAIATIEGIGNFTGSKNVPFTISPCPVTVVAKDASKVFGSADPTFSADVTGVIDGEVTYEVSRDIGEDVGSYAVKPSGKERQGNYLVSFVPGTFTIDKASLSGSTVSSIEPQIATGKELTPKVVVTYNGNQLRQDVDYTVKYRNNVNAGMAAVIVTGAGNYTGQLLTGFTILESGNESGGTHTPTGQVVDLPFDTSVSASLLRNGYSTNAITFVANIPRASRVSFDFNWIRWGSRILFFNITDKDGNEKYSSSSTKDGKASTTVDLPAGPAYFEVFDLGSEDFMTATVTAKCSILPTSLQDAEIRLVEPEPLYYYLYEASNEKVPILHSREGHMVYPQVEVYAKDALGNKTLLNPSTDYTVEYVADGIKPEDVVEGVVPALVVVEGTGDYYGEALLEYIVDNWPISVRDLGLDASCLEQPAYRYNGEPVQPKLRYRPDFVEGVDYTLSYENNDKPGICTVTVTGMGTFYWSTTIEVPIVEEYENPTLDDCILSVVADGEMVYSGKGMKPAVVVYDPDADVVLKEGFDYTVGYQDNVDAGTATIRVYPAMTNDRTYDGCNEVTFTIAPASLTRCRLAITGLGKPCYYNGTERKPELRITDQVSGRELMRDIDYTVAYRDNIEPGLAAVEVTGTGNYEGTLNDEFTILPFVDANISTPHYADIEWLAQTKISEGWRRDDGTREFRGMSPVVRQDMAAFLYRLAGSPAYVPSPADMARFSDVDTSTPHYLEVWWLASTGITTGFPDGTFRGEQRIIRQDMAAFLHRLSNYLGKGSNVRVGRNPFTDVDASTPHSEDIIWMASAGITTGFPDGTYRGWNDVVRQDMAAFLHRLDSLQ